MGERATLAPYGAVNRATNGAHVAAHRRPSPGEEGITKSKR